jgi:tyrosine-protein kinase Etk/Wzc
MSFPEPLIIVAKRKFFILKFVGITAIVTLATVWFWPKSFTASAKIMPPQQTQSMAVAAMTSQLGPLAALGSSLGLRNPGDVYVSMLRSETVANNLIDRFSLMSVYKSDLRMDTQKKLKGRTEVNLAKDGIITVSVDDRSPELAAELANGYIEELEKLTKKLAVTEAGKRRLFYEGEVKAELDELSKAELGLKQTQEKTGIIALEGQAKVVIESVASLRATVTALQIQVQTLQSFATPENPDLIKAEKELAAAQAQLSRMEKNPGNKSILDMPVSAMPAAGLEYLRKYREVKYHESLFTLLARQHEAARIDEGKDAVIIQELDKATPPERKSSPHRAIILLIAVILATIIAVMLAFFMESVERARENPQFAARWQLFKFYLRGRSSS